MQKRKKPKGNAQGWTPLERARPVPKTEAQMKAMSPAALDDYMQQMQRFFDGLSTLWMNDTYTVIRDVMDEGFVHLSIRRNSRSAAHDWRHFQRIKNELCGPEFEAVELYPAESRLMDEANQYHLWVFPAGQRVPVGFTAEFVEQTRDDDTVPEDIGAKQRAKE